MFVIAKVVGFILLPSNFIAALAVLGLMFLLLNWRRAGQGLLILSAFLLLAAGFSPLGAYSLSAIENRFSRPDLKEPIAGIILLGGAIDTHVTASRGQPTVNEAGERLIATAELSRAFPAARLILSGGTNHILTAQPLRESEVAREVLVQLGVAPARIELEAESRDTCEDSSESAKLAQAKPGDTWVIVTSASHMARAINCFDAAGFAVVPYPVDYRTLAGSGSFSIPASVQQGLADVDLAAHEWIGLMGYWLTGRTENLLPPAR